jgi:hypothetical protein
MKRSDSSKTFTLKKFPMLHIKKITKEYENMRKLLTRKKLSTPVESSLSKNLLSNVVSSNLVTRKRWRVPFTPPPPFDFVKWKTKGRAA